MSSHFLCFKILQSVTLKLSYYKLVKKAKVETLKELTNFKIVVLCFIVLVFLITRNIAVTHQYFEYVSFQNANS